MATAILASWPNIASVVLIASSRRAYTPAGGLSSSVSDSELDSSGQGENARSDGSLEDKVVSSPSSSVSGVRTVSERAGSMVHKSAAIDEFGADLT